MVGRGVERAAGDAVREAAGSLGGTKYATNRGRSVFYVQAVKQAAAAQPLAGRAANAEQ